MAQRGLDEQFMEALVEGHLAPLREAVVRDRDLILEIRRNSFDIYFKGQCLLGLAKRGAHYRVTLHQKFRAGISVFPDLKTLDSMGEASAFVAAMPLIKENIIRLRAGGNEIEYEQMLVRANNSEPRSNTEYFLIDRQVVTADGQGQMDLVGLYWGRDNRKRGQEVPLALLEVKFGLNPDISKLHTQLKGYYQSLAGSMEQAASEAELLLRQKLDLDLFQQSKDRLAALRTLRVSRSIEQVRFGIVLVDYNPSSKQLNKGKEALRGLPFAAQIELFYVGFGLWGANRQALVPADLPAGG